MTTASAAARQRFSFRFPVCVLIIGALASAGCTSKYGQQITTVGYYPDCYAPIRDLRASEHSVAKSVGGGAALGAALGALIGYAASGGKGSGALVGAATGAVAGGAAGGIYGQHSKDQEDAARLAEYNAQLDGRIGAVNRTTAAARVARQCYERQFTVAASEYQAGRLTREQFYARYVEVRNGLEEAASILGEANRNGAQVAADYNRALEQESARVAASGKQGGKKNASARAEEGRQLKRMRQTNASIKQSVSAGAEEERQLLERLSLTRRQADDLMS